MSDPEPGPGWWRATDGKWYPPRWEYKWAMGWIKPKKGHEPIEVALDELGRQGWEAVAYSGAEHASIGASHVVVLLKRPLVG